MQSQHTALELGELDDGQLKDIARRIFMNTIAKAEQRVLTELRDDCLALFLQIKNSLTDSDLDPIGNVRSTLTNGAFTTLDLPRIAQRLDQGAFQSDESLAAFFTAFFAWSTRWNLTADWCQLCALKTIRSWNADTFSRAKLGWSFLLYGGDSDVPAGEPPPPEGFPDWNPFEDSKATYVKIIEIEARRRILNDEILSQVEKSHREGFIRMLRPIVMDYQQKVERFYRYYGYQPVKRKELARHIVWTVDFQVRGKKFNEIASVEPQAVRKAVQSILDLIELPRRLVRRGKPLGTKDRGHRRIVRRKREHL